VSRRGRWHPGNQRYSTLASQLAQNNAANVPKDSPLSRRHRDLFLLFSFTWTQQTLACIKHIPFRTRAHFWFGNPAFPDYNMREAILARTMVRESAASLPSRLCALGEGTDLQPAFEQRSRPLSRDWRTQQSRRATRSMTTNPSNQLTNDCPVRK
jgi:hypothetical protein